MELYFKHIVITTMHKDVVSSSIENSSNINGKIKKGKQAGRQAGWQERQIRIAGFVFKVIGRVPRSLP